MVQVSVGRSALHANGLTNHLLHRGSKAASAAPPPLPIRDEELVLTPDLIQDISPEAADGERRVATIREVTAAVG